MIVPRGARPDVAAIAPHYDELDDFYTELARCASVFSAPTSSRERRLT
jgi:hypothetical protein